MVFLLLISFIIRLFSLNQSLWLDEATTARVVLQNGFLEIIAKFAPHDFHPPLFYVFMKLWTNIFGYSEIALRMPSVLFSLMTGFVIYRIGTILKDKKIGLWAALFFLFNPLIIYYSQEARMYSMAAFLLSISLYFLVVLIKRPPIKNPKLEIKKYNFELLSIFIYGLSNALAFATFYGSIFFIVTMHLILLFKKRYSDLIVSGFTFCVLGAILFPLLYQQFMYSREAIVQVVNWSAVLGKTTLKNLLLFPIKFTMGRISFEPKIWYYLAAGSWCLTVGAGVAKQIRKQYLFFLLLIMPIVLGIFFSIFTPLLQYFRFLYCVVPLSILLAFNRSKIFKAFLLIGFIVFSALYVFFPRFHREDWKSLAASLPANSPIYMIVSSSDPIQYYAPMHRIQELRSLGNIELVRQIIVIPYTADIYGYDYKNALSKKGFTYKEAKYFRGLSYEIWVVNRGYAKR